MVAVVVCLVSLFALASAKVAVRNAFVVHETRADAPSGFTRTGDATPSATLNMRVALVSNDNKGLEKQLLAVSTPGSPAYGKHLSTDEVNKYLAPSADSAAAVTGWLASNGINATTITPAGDWLGFSVTVEKANTLLDAKYEVFTHDASGKEQIRTMSYSIPAALQGKLDFVHPTTSFSRPSMGKTMITTAKRSGNGTNDFYWITPAVLQSLYGIPTTKATAPLNSLLVTGYNNNYANKNDLALFLAEWAPNIANGTTFGVGLLDDGQNPQDSQASVETNLDTQYTIGLANGIPVTFLSVGDNNQDGGLMGFLDTVNWVSSLNVVPTVMSTSFGWDESDISYSLADKLCTAYGGLGARGTSLIFDSGDGGVAGWQPKNCTSFVPTFPASCPFVTSVGGTTGSNPETASPMSAGGFSNYFRFPDWQVVDNILYQDSLNGTYKGKYNISSRGVPDVSMQADEYAVYVDGSLGFIGGTSGGPPTFASVVVLINDRLMAAGNPPLGFLNPFLYANTYAFNDITSGSNPGCGTSGYPARAGWDPVTGLGTPIFSKLLAAAQKLYS